MAPPWEGAPPFYGGGLLRAGWVPLRAVSNLGGGSRGVNMSSSSHLAGARGATLPQPPEGPAEPGARSHREDGKLYDLAPADEDGRGD